MKEKETLILPQTGVNKAVLDEALQRLCTNHDFKLDIVFTDNVEDYLKNSKSTLAMLCRCLVESQMHTNSDCMQRLRIGFSYPELAIKLGISLPFKVTNKDGQLRTFQFNTPIVTGDCWGDDVTIPDEAKASFALPTLVPYMHCGRNTVNLSNYQASGLHEAAVNLENALDSLSLSNQGLMARAVHEIPYFKSSLQPSFDPRWKLKFKDAAASVPELSQPAQAGGEKTKHFVYFTSGTDSTLILTTILRLMENAPDDEIVVVCVKHSNMGSGQQERINAALEYLAANVLDMGFSEDVLRRMTIVIPANETIGSHNVGTKAIRIGTKAGEVLLNFMEISSEEQPDLRIGVTAQESMLVAAASIMTPLLGKCRNTFYLGLCSGDAAIGSSRDLREYFHRSFALIADANPHINRDWVPTLEIPLQSMSKGHVIYNLEVLGTRNFCVDKCEDLLMYYFKNDAKHLANEKMLQQQETAGDLSDLEVMLNSFQAVNSQNGSVHDLLGKLRSYHSMYLSLGRPQEFTSFGEFVFTGKLEYLDGDQKVMVADEVIDRIKANDAEKQMWRKMGLAGTMAPDLNFS